MENVLPFEYLPLKALLRDNTNFQQQKKLFLIQYLFV